MFVIARVNPEMIETVPTIVAVLVDMGGLKTVPTIFQEIARAEGLEVTETGVVVCSPEIHLHLIEAPEFTSTNLKNILGGYKYVKDFLSK